MNKNKILKWFLIIALIATPCLAKVRWYNATSLLGGGTSALDSIDGQNLANGNKAIVVTTTNTYYYTLDVDSAAAENALNFSVVSPDTNAGDKRWVLESVVYDSAYSTFTDEDATPSVGDDNLWKTNTTTTTITRFDDGISSQRILIYSDGAITFDTTGNARLLGSSGDIVTASGDITEWFCIVGGTTSSVWSLSNFHDSSADHS